MQEEAKAQPPPPRPLLPLLPHLLTQKGLRGGGMLLRAGARARALWGLSPWHVTTCV